ncbi:MAG TPA: Gfo/Idh/MocA family oxidoreductase [Phycisphaerae bacterium]|nr:Gfo/Idh/MocA family oxidoreductase [Phycisphaerae bacterium]HRR84722.1 Gfo/Idh/MocA family oxidoreductase [Phycisphaerae bacterium]
MQSGKSNGPSRRQVMCGAAVAAATTAFPYVLKGAAFDKPIKVGLIGCGGRGTGAAHNAMEADPAVRIVALADAYKDRLEGCRGELKKRGAEIEDKHCFVGFDAYKKLLELDLDYVILATPPYYRPEHFTAAIKAGKHVFTEKPVAVDPVGIRIMLEAGKMADEKKLSVTAGTQRRHQNSYIETIKRIHDGAIGKILSAQCYWNMGQLWYKEREPKWSDMEWMHRDWVNWAWLSGDHVVEQHVHNLDIINWVLKTHARKAVAMGGRARRVTGDQYDFFSADLSFPNPEAPDKENMDIHVHSMCRQITGCASSVSERVIGEKGISNCAGWISNAGKLDIPGNEPYVQEHVDLIKAIRTGEQINETQNVSESTMTAIMIRMSAYTGKEVAWDDAIESDLKLGPPDYKLEEAEIRKHIPVPGK